MDKFIKENEKLINKTINDFVDEETAKDIKQDVLVKLWQTKSYTKGMAYVKTVVINTCKDFFRSKQYKLSQLNNKDDNELLIVKNEKDNVERKAEQIFRQKTIKNAIDKLPQKLKEVIIMYEINDIDQNTIAKKLNCPLGTVKSRLYNAKKLLYNDLKHLIKENEL